MDIIKKLFVFSLISGIIAIPSQGQIIKLDRGRLWHSFHHAQECSPLSDWQRMSEGLDWPGYEPTELNENLGGTYTHLVAGGIYLTALKPLKDASNQTYFDPDSVLGWMDFALNGDRNTSWVQGQQPFVAREHYKKWPKGENYWGMTDPFEAEEVIYTYLEKDPQYDDSKTENKKFNVSIKREVRQWSGSKIDQDYVIVRYVIKSLRSERRVGLDSAYILLTYALSPNQRGWAYTYPSYRAGARNTHSRWNEEERLLLAWAGDFTLNPQKDDSWDPYESYQYSAIENLERPITEYMAPGMIGIKLLEVSPNDGPDPNKIRFTWSAGPPDSDYQGPFTAVAGMKNKYDAIKDPSLLYDAFDDTNSVLMGQSRLYANFSFGPYSLRGGGGDSIVIVVGQFVGGIPYSKTMINTFDPNEQVEKVREIEAAADSAAKFLNDRLEFNYTHNFTVPLPPPAPPFTVEPDTTSGSVANYILFDGSLDTIPDPQQNVVDLAGYRIYKSKKYPFGPWEMIADFSVKDQKVWKAEQQKYVYKDTQVAMGYGYYYAVTAYDNGHDSWIVDPTVSVPPLESSLYANRTKKPFYSTLVPIKETKGTLDNVVVVPNPFYVTSGFDREGDVKNIQFVNLPPICTIRIFTVKGNLVKTIHHNNSSSGVALWNQISDNEQYVKSGLYFYHIEDEHGNTTRGKFAIIN
ncbi:MAG: hypothetical protein PHS99_03715 [Candidatus Marinimicrobia bacterium]|nr:hypothetical protein [Candidatus Neomarinimicrobiota bacterium]